MRTRTVSFFSAAWIALILVGVTVRVLYTVATPFDVRGHDYDGHLGYVQYVAEHHTLPAEHYNRQTYHPPLYYILGGFTWSVGGALHLSDAMRLELLQLFSLLCSLVSFGVLLWIGYLLFPSAHDRSKRLWFAAVCAVFPSLIFFAPRINNDALFQVFAFLEIAFLLRWWRSPSPTDWYLVSLMLALGMLTKGNMLLFVPIVALCVLVRPDRTWMQKIGLGAFLAVIVLIVAGWFYAPRLLAVREDERTALVGNVNLLTNFVDNTPRAFLTFNPATMLREPYNDPFNSPNRHHLWEYFFRSALTGEFNFGDRAKPLVWLMLISAFLSLPLLAWSMVRDVRAFPSSSTPLLILTLLTLGGFTYYRYVFPYSSSQDFRYTITLIVPIAYYMTHGITARRPLEQWARVLTLGLFTAASTIFLLIVSL